MNKVNYLALGAVALAVISVFLPWIEVTATGGTSDLSETFRPIIIHGISIGYGIFGLLISLLGGYMVFKESRWTFLTGIVCFIDGYGYLHQWFGAGSHDSANYGDVTSKGIVDPKFGMYVFILASLALIVFTLKYYKLKKVQKVVPSEPVQKEHQPTAFTTQSTVASHVYKPSKIQTMSTTSSETPTEPVSSETPKAPVQAAEQAGEQSTAETSTVSEQPTETPKAPENPVTPTEQPAKPTVSAQPTETPKAQVIPEPAPVYQAPQAATSQQPIYEPEKKKSSTTWIFVLVLLVVLVGAGVYVMTNSSSQKSKDKTEQSVNDEKARLQIIVNEVNQDVSDKKYDDALLKINSINWLYEPDANKGYVDQYNSQRENLRNTIEQLKANQSQEDQKQATEKANESSQPVQSNDSIHN